ncbi:helix-turn-helix domain-containing protein [Gloeocapsopsis dulcis]|uniref:Uncharacterized protein n=1 Tax=Gloeocapsopsis dulcis AAB1 = 1H9 TaxID=1433147 RepID=A0A6N8FQJ1_9CHRO|nr:helix-turn-helix domain-containing protein [Gloeocapsopsis dulcis]MUL35094.1 hypothetical protein [Gloeocapsopsis dulcis AAB1 = 1H9]WNN88976.1 helix-turn-helix domain-containing protein [Gloeocapsopsis dulcis]
MKRRCKLQIQETIEQLKELLKQQTIVSGLEKIQALYWFQTGQIKTVTGIATALGKNRTTIHRWWSKYQAGGIRALLGEQKLLPGRKPAIGAEVAEKLASRLAQEKGFKTYEQIQSWLATECGVKASYSVVYKTTRYRLQAQLKVPRPQSIKQDPTHREDFKKTCLFY